MWRGFNELLEVGTVEITTKIIMFRIKNTAARGSLCVAQNIPTDLSRLQMQFLNSVREALGSIQSNLYALRKITCTVWTKKYAVFFGRQTETKVSTKSKKIRVVQFETHIHRKTKHQQANTKPNNKKWPILKVRHCSFMFFLKKNWAWTF